MAGIGKEFTRTDYKFVWYSETNNYLSELNELISYAELPCSNKSCHEIQKEKFEEDIHNFNNLTEEKKVALVRRLIDQLETTNEHLRIIAARCVLFIAQGCINSEILLEKRSCLSTKNTMMLFNLGIFPLFIDLLNMERNSKNYKVGPESYEGTFSQFYHIYVILNVLYLIVENMRVEKISTRLKYKKDVDMFINDVLCCEESDSLLFILFDMVTQFASMKKPGYPIKKILLLIWKIIMISLGDLKELYAEKHKKRLQAGLNVNHLNDFNTTDGKYMLPLLHKISKKDFDSYVYNLHLKYPQLDQSLT
ncbi:hypothetical protein HHI36_015456 [Cryptolaemus montrouzieri]|uniref:Far11/STRP N-terminal domain-containing protein n=1 Tax=Cryptolaemus montrouzieri TaxID=559131 RepID=A0ABD2N5T5_9CUCU